MAHPRYVRSKWLKTEAILRDAFVEPHVPKTARLHESSLISHLDAFHMVYIKPDIGTHGKGIFRVETVHAEHGVEYRLQSADVAHTFADARSMCTAVLHGTTHCDYLVQQGIELLTHKDRRFDIRVMVQIDPSGRWESTGTIGRLAAPQHIVTNYHCGGELMPVNILLNAYVNEHRITEFIRFLYRLGRNAAAAIQRQYPGVNTIGVDIGVDRQLKPWILEANTRPDVHIFKKLQDQTMYRKIRQYAKRLGRI